jgi:hypothetical protein
MEEPRADQPRDPYDALKHAIAHKQQVVATYNGAVRELCPHVLGTKGERRHVLAYQFGGRGSDDQPVKAGWRCFDVDRLQNLATRSGPWHSAANVYNPQSCLDVVDVVVQAFPPWEAASEQAGEAPPES